MLQAKRNKFIHKMRSLAITW